MKIISFLYTFLYIFSVILSVGIPIKAVGAEKNAGHVRVFVVRHGQRELPCPPFYDPSLTALGRKQASAVGMELKKAGFRGRIYVSPYRRTVETALLIGKELNVAPELCPELQEYQPHAGKSRTLARSGTDICREFPALRASSLKADWLVSGPENLDSVRRRGALLLSEILRHNVNSDILLVTHGALLKGIHIAMLNSPYGKIPVMPMNWNCCLSEYNIIISSETAAEPKEIKINRVFDINFMPKSWISSNERYLVSQEKIR